MAYPEGQLRGESRLRSPGVLTSSSDGSKCSCGTLSSHPSVAVRSRCLLARHITPVSPLAGDVRTAWLSGLVVASSGIHGEKRGRGERWLVAGSDLSYDSYMHICLLRREHHSAGGEPRRTRTCGTFSAQELLPRDPNTPCTRRIT